MTPASRWWPDLADLLTNYLKAVAVKQSKEQHSIRGKIYAHTQRWGRLFRDGRLQSQATKVMAAYAGVLMNMVESVGTDQRDDLSWSEAAVDINLQLQIEILNVARMSFPQRQYRHLVLSQTSALARVIVAVMDDDPDTFEREQKVRKNDAIVLGSMCAEWL